MSRFLEAHFLGLLEGYRRGRSRLHKDGQSCHCDWLGSELDGPIGRLMMATADLKRDIYVALFVQCYTTTPH